MEGGLRLSKLVKTSEAGKPLVTIITVVLNGEKYLEQTIKSVLSQTYLNIEYIIIDGGSKDSTVDIIRKHEAQIDYWVSEPDSGLFFAMNKGIKLANGELIGILNADDFYASNIVEPIVKAFEKTSCDIIHGNMMVLGKNTEELARPDISLMNQKPSVFHPTCFVRKTVYEKAGLFNTEFRISSDYEFLLRCIREGFQFHYLNEPITYFRPGGMSGKCASNVEGYKIMKIHQTGYHKQVIWRGIKCYTKQFIKKILNLS